jgi:hypothetical protein
MGNHVTESSAMNKKCDAFGRGDSHLVCRLPYIIVCETFLRARAQLGNQITSGFR